MLGTGVGWHFIGVVRRASYDGGQVCSYGAARDLIGLVLECGLRGLNIQHDVMDRAVYTAQNRLLRQTHALKLREISASMDECTGKMLSLMSWYVSSGCVDHDIHNALKWSIHSQLEDKEFMKRVWKCVASVRRGFHCLVDHVVGWIANTIA